MHNKVYITGFGLHQNGISTENIDSFLNKEFVIESEISPLDNIRRSMSKAIAREDRAILTDAALLSLSSTADALCIAESRATFSTEQRESLMVYTTAEAVRDFHKEFLTYIKGLKLERNDESEVLDKVNSFSKSIYPLRLFKNLPTNNLYHISKFFGLKGGGYPLRKMSLGGLTLVEEAYNKLSISYDESGAVLCAYGDMTLQENKLAFQKMGLLDEDAKKISGKTNLSFGAASLVLENERMLLNDDHHALAEIISTHSIFSTEAFPDKSLWMSLLNSTRNEKANANTNVVIIMYDNGLPHVSDQELNAVHDIYGTQCIIRRYKSITGYAASTSGIADLIMALVDPSIEIGSYIVVNGTGLGMGCGCLVVKKLDNTDCNLVSAIDKR